MSQSGIKGRQEQPPLLAVHRGAQQLGPSNVLPANLLGLSQTIRSPLCEFDERFRRPRMTKLRDVGVLKRQLSEAPLEVLQQRLRRLWEKNSQEGTAHEFEILEIEIAGLHDTKQLRPEASELHHKIRCAERSMTLVVPQEHISLQTAQLLVHYSLGWSVEALPHSTQPTMHQGSQHLPCRAKDFFREEETL